MEDLEARKELVLRSKQGDRAALTCLMEESAVKVAALVRALVPKWNNREDIVQEVLLKAMNNLQSIKDPALFGAYLNQIARNMVFSLLRRKRKRESRPEDFSSRQVSPVENVIQQEEKELVDEALDELSPLDRQVIVLRHWTDASYEDIAQTLNLTVSAVQSKLFRIRKKLRKKLSVRLGRKTN